MAELTDGGSRHVSRLIARPWREVYDYAADPRNLVHWAAGLATATVTPVDDETCDVRFSSAASTDEQIRVASRAPRQA